MIMAVASDHGGFDLKRKVADHLVAEGIRVVDLGTDSRESVDYPVYGKACAEAVASGKADLGIVFCGTGIVSLSSASTLPHNGCTWVCGFIDFSRP